MDLVYVLGPKAVDDLARRLPSAAGKMRRFRVPVDTTLFSPVAPEVRDEARASLLRDLGIGGPARVVIFAGRLESVKRPMAIPAIAAAMASESPPVHFVVAGTGSQEAELRRSAAATAQGRVHLMGSVAPERVATLLRSADVCVLPSGFEALPNIVLESLASGTPVVASQSTGGVADLLAGRAVGRLASEAAQGFASAIREVMAWEGSRAQACREAALAFSPQAVNGDLYEDLRTLVADPVRVR
jgi:glycosyltransferase involved in cell wall biosynthesis